MKTTFIFQFNSLMMIAALLSMLNLNAQTLVYNSSNDDGKRSFKYSDNFTDYDVQVKGDIKVNEDDTRIKSISPGGYLKISKKTFGNKRSVIIESDSKGNLDYAYYEGSHEMPFDPAGKEWLADVLLEVVRISGIDAEGRTKRIYQKSGIGGFMDELDEISSNSVTGMYFDALLDQFTLNESEAQKVIEGISKRIESNTERGRLYRKYSKTFMRTNTLMVAYFNGISRLSSNTERGSILRKISSEIDFNDPQVTNAYFNCVDGLSSNTETGMVLRNVEATQSLSEDAYIRFLHSVQQLSSNTEMGLVLRSLEHLNMENKKISDAYFAAVDNMSSNTEAGTTLRYIISNFDLNEYNLIQLLHSVGRLSSNTEMGSVMRKIKSVDLSDGEMRSAYFDAVNSITSNTEAGNVLTYTYRNHTLNDAAWKDLFRSTAKLSSNTEMGQVLSDAVPLMPFNDGVIDSFFKACDHFASNTEYSRVLTKIAKNDRLTKHACLELIGSAMQLTSNTDKGMVLRAVADTRFIDDEEVKSAFMDAAHTLTSNTEYRNTVEKVVNK